MRKLILLSTVAIIASLAPAARPATRALSARSPAGHKVIVHVVSRDKAITVSSGEHGLLYSLSEKDGRILVADASGEQFEKLHPEMYHFIRGYIAVKNDDRGAFGVDSRADRSSPVPYAGMAMD